MASHESFLPAERQALGRQLAELARSCKTHEAFLAAALDIIASAMLAASVEHTNKVGTQIRDALLTRLGELETRVQQLEATQPPLRSVR